MTMTRMSLRLRRRPASRNRATCPAAADATILQRLPSPSHERRSDRLRHTTMMSRSMGSLAWRFGIANRHFGLDGLHRRNAETRSHERFEYRPPAFGSGVMVGERKNALVFQHAARFRQNAGQPFREDAGIGALDFARRPRGTSRVVAVGGRRYAAARRGRNPRAGSSGHCRRTAGRSGPRRPICRQCRSSWNRRRKDRRALPLRTPGSRPPAETRCSRTIRRPFLRSSCRSA